MTATLSAMLAAFSISGDDAEAFLQSQLSASVLGLQPGDSRRAYYCTAKGRALALLLIGKTPEGDFVALSHTDNIDALIKRLRMFVLRAKVVITPLESSDSSTATWQLANQTVTLAEALALPADTLVDAWLPILPAAAQDAHIPQSLNGDLDGAVDFKKGCYPGQEIVARTHYLGKVKRRMVQIHWQGNAAVAAGEPVLVDDKAVGEVVLAGQSSALVTLQVAHRNAALTIAGMPLTVQTPSYPVPELSD